MVEIKLHLKLATLQPLNSPLKLTKMCCINKVKRQKRSKIVGESSLC